MTRPPSLPHALLLTAASFATTALLIYVDVASAVIA